MNDQVVLVDGQEYVVPYRVESAGMTFSKKDVLYYCRKSRNHNGYKREKALREVLSHRLSNEAVAYVFVALGDYVIEISSLPLTASAQIKEGLRKIVKENNKLVSYTEAVTISYWNEYYRDSFATYNDYPPYKFLQSLK